MMAILAGRSSGVNRFRIYLNGEEAGRKFGIAESADGVACQTLALAIQFGGTEADPTVVRLAAGIAPHVLDVAGLRGVAERDQ